jgi:hypothetical protein
MWKILFDCWIALLISSRMFITTVKLSLFITDITSSVGLISLPLLIIYSVSFFIDILFSFKTGFYRSGVIVTEPREIILNYKETQLKYDAISYVPLIVAFFVNQNSSYQMVLASYVLEFLVFAKWFSLLNVMSRVERVFTENDKVALYWPIM